MTNERHAELLSENVPSLLLKLQQAAERFAEQQYELGNRFECKMAAHKAKQLQAAYKAAKRVSE